MIRVMIVDDHRLVRVALSAMLADVRGMEVVGQADSGEEAMVLAKESASCASKIGDRYEESVALRAVGLSMVELGQQDEGERR